jgi:hypothetical protein
MSVEAPGSSPLLWTVITLLGKPGVTMDAVTSWMEGFCSNSAFRVWIAVLYGGRKPAQGNHVRDQTQCPCSSYNSPAG